VDGFRLHDLLGWMGKVWITQRDRDSNGLLSKHGEGLAIRAERGGRGLRVLPRKGATDIHAWGGCEQQSVPSRILQPAMRETFLRLESINASPVAVHSCRCVRVSGGYEDSRAELAVCLVSLVA
jgi:hypothetical protein